MEEEGPFLLGSPGCRVQGNFNRFVLSALQAHASSVATKGLTASYPPNPLSSHSQAHKHILSPSSSLSSVPLTQPLDRHRGLVNDSSPYISPFLCKCVFLSF